MLLDVISKLDDAVARNVFFLLGPASQLCCLLPHVGSEAKCLYGCIETAIFCGDEIFQTAHRFFGLRHWSWFTLELRQQEWLLQPTL